MRVGLARQSLPSHVYTLIWQRTAAFGLGMMAVQGGVVPIVQRRINAVRRANADMIAAAETEAPSACRHALREVRLSYRLRLRMNVLKAGLKAFLKLGDNLAVIAVPGVGGIMVVQGETTLGIVVASLEGLRRVRQPWDALVSFYRPFADAQIGYRLLLGAMGRSVVIEPDRAPGPAARVTLP